MKYLIVVTQKGEGCDYTIDCGKTYKFFESTTDEQALIYLEEFIDDYGGPSDNGYGFEDIHLIQVGNELYNTDDYKKAIYELNEAVEQEEQETLEALERSTYEKLKQKYE